MKRDIDIIATGINNLTDARYFAAMGVQWLTFDLRHEPRISPEQMDAIMDWVEGPHWLIEVNDTTRDDHREGIAGCITDRLPSSTTQGRVIVRITGGNEIPDTAILLEMHNEDEASVIRVLSSISHDHDLWVSAHWTEKSVKTALNNTAITGLVVRAGSEEIVGIKDYSAIDALFDTIGD